MGLQPFKNSAPDRIRTFNLCLRRGALYPAELGLNTFFTSLRESTQELSNAISRLPLLYITHEPFRGRITFYI